MFQSNSLEEEVNHKDSPTMIKIKEDGRLMKIWNEFSDQQTKGSLVYTDAELICMDGGVPVHAIILANASPLFKAAFESQGGDVGVRTVILSEWKVRDVYMVVQLLYYGFVNVPTQVDIKSLNEIVRALEIKPLLKSLKVERTESPDTRSILYYDYDCNDDDFVIQPVPKLEEKEEENGVSEMDTEVILIAEVDPKKNKNVEEINISDSPPSSSSTPTSTTLKQHLVSEESTKKKLNTKTRKNPCPRRVVKVNVDSPMKYLRPDTRKGRQKDLIETKTEILRKRNTRSTTKTLGANSLRRSAVPKRTRSISESPAKKKVKVESVVDESQWDVNDGEVEDLDYQLGSDVDDDYYNDYGRIYKRAINCRNCPEVHTDAKSAAVCVNTHKMVRCSLCFAVFKSTHGLDFHLEHKHQHKRSNDTILCPYFKCQQPFNQETIAAHVLAAHVRKPKNGSGGAQLVRKSLSRSPEKVTKKTEKSKSDDRASNSGGNNSSKEKKKKKSGGGGIFITKKYVGTEKKSITFKL